MSLLRRVARPMLAVPFITGGIDVLRNPDPRAKLAAPVAAKMAEVLPVPLPSDPVQLVQIDAGLKILGGLMLATGRMPRLAALGLAASLVPTTLAGHSFWEHDDPQQRAHQRIHFGKNVGLIGGLLITAADTGGRPSVGWATRQAAKRSRRRAGKAAKRARDKLS
ncbi:MAG: DoxX family protein [Actinomycetota bacterium]|nr:DoxX family protein [Actinomycetota bacterium]